MATAAPARMLGGELPPLAILPDLKERWDQWYKTNVREKARSYEEERALILDWLEKIETEGWTLNDEMQLVQVTRAQEWTPARFRAAANVEFAPAAGAMPAGAGGSATGAAAVKVGPVRLLVIATVVLGLLVLLGVTWGFIKLPGGGGGGASGAAAGAPGGGAAGATPNLTPVPAVDTGSKKFPLTQPRSLEIVRDGVTQGVYALVPGEVQANGQPKYMQDALSQGAMVWFPPTGNWILGAAPDVAAGMQIGDRLVARTATGHVLTFVVDRIETPVQPQQTDILLQGRAGVTIFALPFSGEGLVVFALYDPSQEVPESEAADGVIGQPVTLGSGGVITVTNLIVNRRAESFYAITVEAQAQGLVPSVALDLSGQLYPAAGAPGAGGSAQYEFSVPGLGSAVLLVGDRRIALGELVTPQLTAVVKSSVQTGTALELQLEVRCAGGATAIQPGDIAILLNWDGLEARGGEIAPVQVTPAGIAIGGQPVPVTVLFTVPGNEQVEYIRVFGQVYQRGR